MECVRVDQMPKETVELHHLERGALFVFESDVEDNQVVRMKTDGPCTSGYARYVAIM